MVKHNSLKTSVEPFQFKQYTKTDKYLLYFLIGLTFLYGAFLVYFSSQCYFSRDDFPLIVESFQSIEHIVNPIGKAHFRPIIRLHFYLHYLIGFSPFLFHMINVLLHLLSAVLLYKILQKYYSHKTSLFASLLFFNSFSYNEILFWISTVQLEYCLIFGLISIHFYHKKKAVYSIFFLILSSLAYELWIVVPVYFIFSKGKKIAVITSSIFLTLFHFAVLRFFHMDISGYGGFPELDDILFRIVFFLSKSVAPFSDPDRISSIILFSGLILASVFFYTKKRDKALLPLIFYFVPASLFLMSNYIPSRFFYYSAISFAIVLALMLDSKRIFKLIGSMLILYLMTLSAVLNYLDGMDYLNYSREHKKIIQMGEEISGLKQGDRIRLINRMDDSVPIRYSIERRGRVKLLFKRPRGFGGLIDPDVTVDFILFPGGLKSIPIERTPDLKKILIGNGRLVSEYSFKVKKR